MEDLSRLCRNLGKAYRTGARYMPVPGPDGCISGEHTVSEEETPPHVEGGDTHAGSVPLSDSEMGHWSEVQTEAEKEVLTEPMPVEQSMPVEPGGASSCAARSRSRSPMPRCLRRRCPVVVVASSTTSSSRSSCTSSRRSTSGTSSSSSTSSSTSTDSRPLTDLLVENKESSTTDI
eukprot:6462981-Amphidinium_carterae.3